MCSCEPERAPLRVAMLLSGGVDSSVALRLAQVPIPTCLLSVWNPGFSHDDCILSADELRKKPPCKHLVQPSNARLCLCRWEHPGGASYWKHVAMHQ